MTVHNLHKLFVLNEIFKIKKYRSPISLHNFVHKTSESSRKCRLALPNYRLNVSRNQFFHYGITTWNQMSDTIDKYTCMEATIDFPADLSISFKVAKRKFKATLLKLQSNGNISIWERHNFVLS